jgi:hypothetical protein
MRISSFCVAATMLACSSAANATVFSFLSDPFAGTDALITPGRQIIQAPAVVEPSIDFQVGSDVFVFDKATFGIDTLTFANGLVADIPASGVNVVVLQTVDNDNNAATPFVAGVAANIIAEQITTSGAGFFIYFNSVLDLPRLVFSTDLSDPNADLRVLVRLGNFAGESGELVNFTADNFELVPEPSGLLLVAAGAAWFCHARRRRTTGPLRG